MKSLIISDIHAKKPFELIKKKLDEGIERVIFLGDCEDQLVLAEFLESKFNKIMLLGNHDYPYVYSYITSGRVHPSTDYLNVGEEELKSNYKAWREIKILQDYANKFFRKKEEKDFDFRFIEKINKENIVYVHGALFDPEAEKRGPIQLWATLIDNYGRVDDIKIGHNFLAMQEQDFWIMFRGHDHGAYLWSINNDDNAIWKGFLHHENPTKKIQKFQLEKESRYIASVGAYSRGSYAIFDDASLELEYWREY